MAELLLKFGAGHMVRQPLESPVGDYLEHLDRFGVDGLRAIGGDRLLAPVVHLVRPS